MPYSVVQQNQIAKMQYGVYKKLYEKVENFGWLSQKFKDLVSHVKYKIVYVKDILEGKSHLNDNYNFTSEERKTALKIVYSEFLKNIFENISNYATDDITSLLEKSIQPEDSNQLNTLNEKTKNLMDKLTEFVGNISKKNKITKQINKYEDMVRNFPKIFIIINIAINIIVYLTAIYFFPQIIATAILFATTITLVIIFKMIIANIRSKKDNLDKNLESYDKPLDQLEKYIDNLETSEMQSFLKNSPLFDLLFNMNGIMLTKNVKKHSNKNYHVPSSKNLEISISKVETVIETMNKLKNLELPSIEK